MCHFNEMTLQRLLAEKNTELIAKFRLKFNKCLEVLKR